jgi:hypothetical protein
LQGLWNHCSTVLNLIKIVMEKWKVTRGSNNFIFVVPFGFAAQHWNWASLNRWKRHASISAPQWISDFLMQRQHGLHIHNPLRTKEHQPSNSHPC